MPRDEWNKGINLLWIREHFNIQEGGTLFLSGNKGKLSVNILGKGKVEVYFCGEGTGENGA